MKDRALASEHIVGVSDGDQDTYENVTTGHQDSYSGIQCNVCHNDSNQTLLLLCDLCHSSSHTYCVGLGDTVPKNDWTCGKCTLLMIEHAEDDKDLDAPCTNAGDGISIASSKAGHNSQSSFPVREPGVGNLSSGTPSDLNSSYSSPIISDPSRQDIKKAWKMMNAAMSIEKKKKTNNLHFSSNGSKHSSSDMRTPKESSSVRSSHHSTGDKGQDFKKFKRPYQDCDAQKHNDKRKLHMFQQKNASTVPNFDFSTSGSAGPVAKVPLSSSCNIIEVTNEEKHNADAEAKLDSDAKSEIQSLVKLNLKFSSTKKKLDPNEFKEVARLATHSILAACGIGQPKSWVRPFPSPNCSHVEVEKVRRSTLLSSSCRECFLVFVKDVVNIFFLEKTTSK